MEDRMKSRTIFLLGAFAALVAIQPASGQTTAARRTSSAGKPAVRTGVAQSAPPPQPIVVNTTGLPPAGIPTQAPIPVTTIVPVGVAQISWYPTMVLSDGTVWANFGTGRGYEQVLRQCPQITGALPPNATIAPCFTVDGKGYYRVMQRR
jgi:hypothetical protein